MHLKKLALKSSPLYCRVGWGYSDKVFVYFLFIQTTTFWIKYLSYSSYAHLCKHMYGGPLLSACFCSLNVVFIVKLNSNYVLNHNITVKADFKFQFYKSISKSISNLNHNINSKVKKLI